MKKTSSTIFEFHTMINEFPRKFLHVPIFPKIFNSSQGLEHPFFRNKVLKKSSINCKNDAHFQHSVARNKKLSTNQFNRYLHTVFFKFSPVMPRDYLYRVKQFAVKNLCRVTAAKERINASVLLNSVLQHP